MHKANINWLNEQVATGGDFAYLSDVAGDQLADILDQDIRLVIDCRMECDDADLWEAVQGEGHDIVYLHLPTNDMHGWEIPAAHFDAAVGAAMPFLERGEKVLAHCHMGINRGPSTAFALLLAQGMEATEAFDLIRQNRPQAAVAYAMDAYRAHLRRVGIKRNTATYKRRLAILDEHIDKVMTPKARREIQHIMREGHESDSRQRRIGVM